MRRLLAALVAVCVSCAGTLYGFAYLFAAEGYPDLVPHAAPAYDGVNGGVFTITVGAHTGDFSQEFLDAIVRAMNTWDSPTATTGNLDYSSVPPSQADFETVVLHELGHALGLAHPNISSATRYANSFDGVNDSYDLGAGVDGIPGTNDDVRGDDVNRCWYEISDPSDDPFGANPATVDSTTFHCPDSFQNTSTREVAQALGYGANDTESVMTQGAYSGEAQRTLTSDDVAGILYEWAGVDEIAGTADDYSYDLQWMGERDTDDVNIYIYRDDGVSLASTTATADAWFVFEEHLRLNSADVRINMQDIDWYVPEPGSFGLLSIGLIGMLGLLRRRHAMKK